MQKNGIGASACLATLGCCPGSQSLASGIQRSRCNSLNSIAGGYDQRRCSPECRHRIAASTGSIVTIGGSSSSSSSSSRQKQ